MGKMYDDKVPLNEEYRTDGGAETVDRWRHKVRGYFIGKVPALLPLLDWAERKDHHNISAEDVRAEALRAGTLSPAEIAMVNGAVWTSLQMCTSGGASDVMNLVPELNGLEAWRALMVMANRGRNLRLAGLRRAVRKPESITKLEGVHAGIVRFDMAAKKLQEAGGTLPSEQERKQDLLDILPSDLRESLMWRAEQPDGYAAFREHVITKAAEVMDI